MNRSIGIVGLGKMGLPIAHRLVQAGVHIEVVEPDVQRTRDLRPEHFTVRECSADLSANVDAVLVIVGTDDQLLESCLDPARGIVAAEAVQTVVVHATVDPSTVVDLSDRLAGRADPIDVLDAPLCRGEAAAERGDLLALLGGSEKVVEKMIPTLETYCSAHFRLGDVGAGQVAKMLNNVLLWASITANFEAMQVGRSSGLDLDVLREALLQSSGANWALQTWGQARDMPWAEKDMEIAVRYVEAIGLGNSFFTATQERITGIRRTKIAWQAPRSGLSMDEFVKSMATSSAFDDEATES